MKDKYNKRVYTFYKYNNKNNCKKVYDVILNLKNKIWDLFLSFKKKLLKKSNSYNHYKDKNERLIKENDELKVEEITVDRFIEENNLNQIHYNWR